MFGRAKRMEIQRNKELASFGITIDGVRGTAGYGSFLACLAKAAIIFLVCSGTVTGFCDAFELEYNKTAVILFTAAAACIMSLLYYNKKTFYFGYSVLFVLFAVELFRYYVYVNSGFQAIMNTLRQAYADKLGLSYVRNAEEMLENRYVTITVAAIFIVIFITILLNITVSRYMNFPETAGIAFIILELPLYIGYKPPLLSIVAVMAGCIATGILQNGAYMRMVVPSRKHSEYIYSSLFGKNSFTTRGSIKGMALVTAAALLFSFFLCVFSVVIYDRPGERAEQGSAKEAVDDKIKILVQNGIWGFFDRYDSVNGLYRGALGGVSSVNPDFRTDLVVSYTPYSTSTLYLAGYKGTSYSGSNWYNYAIYDSTGLQSYFADDVDRMEDTVNETFFRQSEDRGKIEISYIDFVSGEMLPYVSLRNSVAAVDSPFFSKSEGALADRLSQVHGTVSTEFVPLFIEESDYDNGMAGLGCDISRIPEKGSDYNRYIRNICTEVPTALDGYLEEFCAVRNNFGIDLSIAGKRRGINTVNAGAVNAERISACRAIAQLFEDEYPYTLSPGKTPANEDFVGYFLKEQKRGYCAHFASAAVMLLRHMGIPARYIEGYCVPYALALKNGTVLEVPEEEWYTGEPRANTEKRTVAVEVSDYYAHAWVEVYLEGIGFVPFEVTPASNEAIPSGISGGGLRSFFSRLMNVDLGIGIPGDDTISFDNNISEIPVQETATAGKSVILLPALLVAAAVLAVWLLVLLIRYIRKRLMLGRLYRNGSFDRLIYIDYNELASFAKKKGFTTEENPLPAELGERLSEITGDKKALELTRYAEKILYSETPSDAAGYTAFKNGTDELKKTLKNLK